MTPPCPDEYCNLDWTAYLQEPTMPQPPPERNLHPAYWAMGLVLLAVLVYEAIAVLTKYRVPTISQGVQRGPRWYRWSMGAGLGLLIYHFLFQGR